MECDKAHFVRRNLKTQKSWVFWISLVLLVPLVQGQHTRPSVAKHWSLIIYLPSIWTATWRVPLYLQCSAYFAIPMPMMVWLSLSIWRERLWNLIDGVVAGLENIKRRKTANNENKCWLTFLLCGGDLIHMSIDFSAELLNCVVMFSPWAPPGHGSGLCSNWQLWARYSAHSWVDWLSCK